MVIRTLTGAFAGDVGAGDDGEDGKDGDFEKSPQSLNVDQILNFYS